MKATIDWDKSIISTASQDNFWKPEDIDFSEKHIFESRNDAITFKRMIEGMSGVHVYAPNVPDSFKNYASCKVTCTDSLDSLKEGLNMVDNGKSGLGIVIDTPGGHMDSTLTARAAVQSNLDGHINIVMAKDREPIHSQMDGIMDYALHKITFDNIECKQLFPDVVKDIQTPPKGRSQKQHNLIQAMNKRGRY